MITRHGSGRHHQIGAGPTQNVTLPACAHTREEVGARRNRDREFVAEPDEVACNFPADAGVSAHGADRVAA